jgi:hypothetical protein
MYKYSEGNICSAVEEFLTNSMCRVVDFESLMEIL